MHSRDLLPALRELPTGASGQRMSFRDMIGGLTSTDSTMYAAELASGVSLSMWAVFDRVNRGRQPRRSLRNPLAGHGC